MKLTKSEAVRLHREMWNWIADELEEGALWNIYDLKNLYLDEIGIDSDEVDNCCFCCEYTRTGDNIFDCSRCPLIWGTENNVKSYFCEEGLLDIPEGLPAPDINTEGLWTNARELIWEGRQEDAAKYARYIANLPEKEDV